MTKDEVLRTLEALGDAKVRAQNAKKGAGDNQFGVRLGEIRKLAKKIKRDHELARALWATGNIDARFLATLVVDPARLPAKELDAMVQSITFTRVADWVLSYVVKVHPEKEALRATWMKAKHPMALRAGWSETAGRVAQDADGVDVAALLDRIEKEAPAAAPETQWTMNNCLAAIGIHHEAHRDRAIALGETLGLFRDYPVSKGCTSPFAPIWIREMVKRQG